MCADRGSTGVGLAGGIWRPPLPASGSGIASAGRRIEPRRSMRIFPQRCKTLGYVMEGQHGQYDHAAMEP